MYSKERESRVFKGGEEREQGVFQVKGEARVGRFGEGRLRAGSGSALSCRAGQGLSQRHPEQGWTRFRSCARAGEACGRQKSVCARGCRWGGAGRRGCLDFTQRPRSEGGGRARQGQ